MRLISKGGVLRVPKNMWMLVHIDVSVHMFDLGSVLGY